MEAITILAFLFWAADPAEVSSPPPAPDQGHPPQAEPKTPRRLNLVPNPGFEEKGVAGPKGWGMVGIPEGADEVDGLTSFWAKEGKDGSFCLKYDTNVLLEEAKARWEAVRAGKHVPAKPKSPTSPPYYDTVGGNDGVNILSDFIEVKPDMAYDVEVDYRTDGPDAILFIRGYVEMPMKGPKGADGKPVLERREAFKYQRNLDSTMAGHKRGEWVRLKDHNTFYPTARTPKVRWIRVSLYAYWPVGNIWFDDVAVYENPNAPPYQPPRDIDRPRSRK